MATSQQSPSIDLTNLYTALADTRRRYAVKILSNTDRPIPLADLAADIAKEEIGKSTKEIEKDKIRSIYGSLYHNHIPKMQDLGIVEYNTSRQTVRLKESQQSADLSRWVAKYE